MIGSPQDILMIAVVGFILFGSKKLPEMARSIGTSINEFKKVVNGQEEAKEGEAKPAAPAAEATPAPVAEATPAPVAEAKPATAVADPPAAIHEPEKKA